MAHSSEPRQGTVQKKDETSPQTFAQVKSETSFVDKRASATSQLQLKAMMDASPRHDNLRDLKQLMANHAKTGATSVQRQVNEELVQGQFAVPAMTQLQDAPATANRAGLSNQLKTGVETLSGMSLDNVRVHYNSSQPAQLNAHAYAQGNDIHLAPGQEQHLPHEAWHVVQQAQGRVKPTLQMKGTAVNDDVGLESEADVMGAKAQAVGIQHIATQSVATKQFRPAAHLPSSPPVQRLYNSLERDAFTNEAPQIDKGDIALSAAFKQKHVASSIEDAKKNTEARVASGTPAVIVNGTKPNTCAPEHEWLNAIHETKEEIALSGKYTGYIPVVLSSGWTTTHNAGTYTQAALDNAKYSVGAIGKEVALRKNEIKNKVEVTHVGDA